MYKRTRVARSEGKNRKETFQNARKSEVENQRTQNNRKAKSC